MEYNPPRVCPLISIEHKLQNTFDYKIDLMLDTNFAIQKIIPKNSNANQYFMKKNPNKFDLETQNVLKLGIKKDYTEEDIFSKTEILNQLLLNKKRPRKKDPLKSPKGELFSNKIKIQSNEHDLSFNETKNNNDFESSEININNNNNEIPEEISKAIFTFCNSMDIKVKLLQIKKFVSYYKKNFHDEKNNTVFLMALASYLKQETSEIKEWMDYESKKTSIETTLTAICKDTTHIISCHDNKKLEYKGGEVLDSDGKELKGFLMKKIIRFKKFSSEQEEIIARSMTIINKYLEQYNTINGKKKYSISYHKDRLTKRFRENIDKIKHIIQFTEDELQGLTIPQNHTTHLSSEIPESNNNDNELNPPFLLPPVKLPIKKKIGQLMPFTIDNIFKNSTVDSRPPPSLSQQNSYYSPQPIRVNNIPKSPIKAKKYIIKQFEENDFLVENKD